MGGNLAPSLDHLVACLHDGIAADNHRFRAAGAAAGDQFVAVALYQANALEGDAEAGGEDLRERRSMPLPVVERAGDDRDIAIWFEANAAHLAPRRTGQFEVIADAAPAQATARPALFL